MFQIKKIGVNSDGSLDIGNISLFSNTSPSGSVTSGFSFFSGGVLKVPMFIDYVDSDHIGSPVLSDIILSLSCMLSSSDYSNEYSFEKYDSNSNYVYFKHIDTGKLVKCRLLLPKTYLDIKDSSVCSKFNINNLSNFTQACPDDSGAFYISNSTDFSNKVIFFVLEFVFDSKFVQSYNSKLLFQLGFNIFSLSSAPSYSSSSKVPVSLS